MTETKMAEPNGVAKPTTTASSTGLVKPAVAGFGTLAVHAGSPHDAVTGAVIEAISLSTTFAQSAVGQPVGAFEYSRSSNPNRANFEQAVAALEHARHALAFSSGSAATATAHNIRVTFTPAIEVDIVSHITPATRLVWIETPSNPTLRLVDIDAVSRAAHARGVLVVVDNTFLSPYIQNPLDHGADIVVHSVTKYINGHSDVVMGVAACNRDDLHARLAFLQNAGGAVPSAFDSWLAHRGLKTLHLRARAASTNALQLATALEGRPDLVSAVHYPGLDSHPQRPIALRQHRDGLGGGMLSFRLRAGHAAAERFCQNTRLFTLAESLGGIESLVEVPSSMTHAGIPRDQREAVGVFDDLVRVSCGIEDSADLLYDALQALERASVEPEALNGNGSAVAH
ncbi:cystathionine gamma-lyase [Grosmannia clavigera kw1407]|uniref:cystathionine gamma-lyase n=1 Tax=Grosmannia clavigera (strain kw1407 / UAMH 11150) TaxID=655863 RepID=F0XSE8_GROCL|nr:cystathionine gamma-lyase [Grosmannia clavigera kw1407]EFW99562.1 cystathionine gamma-lyase [Grosmannia clavigera kw1407]